MSTTHRPPAVINSTPLPPSSDPGASAGSVLKAGDPQLRLQKNNPVCPAYTQSNPYLRRRRPAPRGRGGRFSRGAARWVRAGSAWGCPLPGRPFLGLGLGGGGGPGVKKSSRRSLPAPPSPGVLPARAGGGESYSGAPTPALSPAPAIFRGTAAAGRASPEKPTGPGGLPVLPTRVFPVRALGRKPRLRPERGTLLYLPESPRPPWAPIAPWEGRLPRGRPALGSGSGHLSPSRVPTRGGAWAPATPGGLPGPTAKGWAVLTSRPLINLHREKPARSAPGRPPGSASGPWSQARGGGAAKMPGDRELGRGGG